LHFEAQNLARLAFGDDLEGTATDLAIRCKALEGGACVNDDFKSLPAIGALDGLRDFHAATLVALHGKAKLAAGFAPGEKLASIGNPAAGGFQRNLLHWKGRYDLRPGREKDWRPV
jgi:hypothetical protein